MEIKFENKYLRDKEWAKDIYGYMYFKRPLMIVIYAVMALYLAFGIYNTVRYGYIDRYFLIVPIGFSIMIAFLYNKNVTVTLKRDMEIHGKAIETSVTVTDEVIRHSTSLGSEYFLNYVDVKKAVQTKKFIYLWSKANMFYSLKKDAFTQGSAEEFIAFLNTKGIKVK